MAQAKNDNRFGGEYMIQDRDHMSDAGEASKTEQKAGVRHVEQSQMGSRQQGGGNQNTSGEQGTGQQSGDWGHLTR